MRNFSAHEDHEVMNKLNNLGCHDTNQHGFKQRTMGQFHEMRLKPQQETLQPSRRLIQLVNRDNVFADAKRAIGLFPQVAFKLVKSAGLERARMTTAFVLSLFQTEYFAVDLKGHYDPSIVGQQERARAMLQGLVYGKKPIYLSYAGPYFFTQFPDYREVLRQDGQATA